MSLNTNPDLKLYYSISEVAAQFDVAESLLRFWEKQFPNIHPKKGGNNVRQYTQADIEEIRVVYNLVKVRGMKLNAAKEILSKNKKVPVRPRPSSTSYKTCVKNWWHCAKN